MEALLSVENVSKVFTPRPMSGAGTTVHALEGINLNIPSGARIAIVGGSGSGKSTLAACLACLEKPTSGKIYFQGRDVTALSERELRPIRPQVQLVFQDSANAFNPDLTILQILEEPLLLNSKCDSEERQTRAATLLRSVGIPSEMLARKAAELSGGQRQRVGLVRALALEPKVLILDEALSALDSSVQAQIANQLLDLNSNPTQTDINSALLIITHDLVMAARLADEIVIMQNGLIVERGPSRRIMTAPEHEATKALVAATPQFATHSGPAT
jgi:peptide/nickel transport system ATP-binding protein